MIPLVAQVWFAGRSYQSIAIHSVRALARDCRPRSHQSIDIYGVRAPARVEICRPRSFQSIFVYSVRPAAHMGIAALEQSIAVSSVHDFVTVYLRAQVYFER